MDEMIINSEELELVISNLEEKIKNLNNSYEELNNKLKIIDETSEVWTGTARIAAYNKYLEISKNYTSTLNQVKALKIFLENTLNNYLNSDNKINESIENNKEDLEVND